MVESTIKVMGKKKPGSDRHKPRKLVGIPLRVCAALKSMGEQREASLAEMVKVACIEYLERNNRWPPRPAGDK